jgi:hypothetical protein
MNWHAEVFAIAWHVAPASGGARIKQPKPNNLLHAQVSKMQETSDTTERMKHLMTSAILLRGRMLPSNMGNATWLLD